MIGLYVLYGILGALGALLLFMIVRTALARPKKKSVEYTPHPVDQEEITEILQKAVRIPTVTKYREGDDQSSFPVYHEFLKTAFPEIFSRAEVTLVHGYSLIIKVKGADESLMPGAILAHQDVVPAPKEGWDVDPFSGELVDGYVYGRGSQDMKSQMMTALYALELLLREGKEPKRTVYYCFGHDEEFQGKEGARYIVQTLKEQDVRFAFVLDEGGTIIDGSMLGVKGFIALIGTCEKGYADFELSCVKDGGHASAPKRKSSVDAIADAIHDLRRTPTKRRWSEPLRQMFRDVAPHMSPLFKFVFVNRDILSPLLKIVMTAITPFTNSVLRTTFAFTQMKGSDAVNVIPAKATAIVNCRVNIGESCDDTKKFIEKAVGKEIDVEYYGLHFDPTPVSKAKGSDVYEKLVASINDVYKDFVVAPYPFPAATDAKYYYAISDNVYRFTPFAYSLDDQKRIHGINERCLASSLPQATQFFIEFLNKTCY